MRRLLDIIASLMLVFALMTGTAAHAVEIRGFSAIEVTDECAQVSEQRDKEAPGDSGKALVHQHGCHGHHVGVPIGPDAVLVSAFDSPRIPLPLAHGVVSLAPKGTFRPPIA